MSTTIKDMRGYMPWIMAKMKSPSWLLEGRTLLGVASTSLKSNPIRPFSHFTKNAPSHTINSSASLKLFSPSIYWSWGRMRKEFGPQQGGKQGRQRFSSSSWGSRSSSSSGVLSFLRDYCVEIIIGVNCIVFLCWQYAKNTYRVTGDGSPLRIMSNNFLNSTVHCLTRPWTLITCAFSHSDLMHLGLNCFVLHSFGTALRAEIGSASFLRLYFASALGASLASLAHQYYISGKKSPSSSSSWGVGRYIAPITSSHGASGAVAGATCVFAILYPTVPIYLFAIVPVPAAVCVGGFVAWDLWKSWSGTAGLVDSAGHLGGALSGLAFWWYGIRRGRMPRRVSVSRNLMNRHR